VRFSLFTSPLWNPSKEQRLLFLIFAVLLAEEAILLRGENKLEKPRALPVAEPNDPLGCHFFLLLLYCTIIFYFTATVGNCTHTSPRPLLFSFALL
jgi:hypothetical protein